LEDVKVPQQRSNKSQTPINSDAFNLIPDLATFADSLEVLVPVADDAEGDTVATARAAAGWPVTNARPLFVYNTTTKTIRVKDGSGWRELADAYVRPFGHMGKTTNFQGIQTTDTVVTMDAAQILRGGMTFSNADDALVVPIAGYYKFTAQFYATGGSGAVCSGVVHRNGVTVGVQARFWKADPGDYIATASGAGLCAAGDKIRLVMTYTPSSTWGSTGFDGTFLEVEYIGPA
jgi:hypothetical protein